MMNYQIITNEAALKSFIDWLPELERHETFYCCLFARSKYLKDISETLPHIRSDKAQLKRFTSTKERLIGKIKQLECPIGSYMQRDIIVPQEALALYITINPRDMIKAGKNSIKKLLDLALQEYNGYHPYQEVMSEIQKAKSKSHFVTFDFDVQKEDYANFWPLLQDCVNPEALNVVETRGGYHVIVRVDAVGYGFRNLWYNNIKKILSFYSSDTENCGDIMLPVPGTYQGGFTPTFLTPSHKVKAR